ncbi:beta-1,4-glucuronyltransferase 1 isoform X2 [Halyomorpha halys]|uniref:beta-1,4-glucuronyltransferase 1 isoform X2 n=1 Tax=Halyomorpha halys TaxID=286706 RepID=UPI0006D5047A|nr:beta-1,4-glucuronyltransferase 1 isoform X2 [Halyomorpha halys]XP_014274470.1 beta-1,4-glucuronyltransferase 1 isoform X2 [Halyomorpha halys]
MVDILVGCRIWNFGVVSVLVLTVCNILLMLKLLHIERSDGGQAGPRPVPPLPPVIMDAFFPHNITPVFEMNIHLGHWDNRRLLKMIDHALVGTLFDELSKRYSVCLATQSSLEKLHSLVQVANHWRGPISAALFAAGDEEFGLLQGYIDYLRHCYPAVRDRVSFHLAFPWDRLPSKNQPVKREGKLDCLHPEGFLHQLLKHRSSELLRWRQKNPYPQNHLRNLARKNCQTSRVFLTDVDIIPSLGMADGLEVFIKSDSCTSLCAYVIPTYEVDERVPFPKNKSELIRLKGRGLARPFHHKVFIYNQYATNFSRWEQDQSRNQVHISHGVTNFEFLYEPFYIAHDNVPPHDERFIGYGFTRNTQVYEMFVAGYQFFVLSPVFTVHWGLQHRKGRPSWRERQNANNRKFFEQFKREVFTRYHKDPLHMVLHHTKDGQTAKS